MGCCQGRSALGFVPGGLFTLFQIAANARIGEQGIDAERLVEALVGQELDPGGILELRRPATSFWKKAVWCAGP
jgi:hypothetical protein